MTAAKKTIETLNSGASLASLGITEQRAEELAKSATTIGSFLQQLRVESRRNQDALAKRLQEKDWYRVWIVVIAGEDPESDVAALTRGVYFSADIGRLLKSTVANVVADLKPHSEKVGLLGTMLDVKIIYLRCTTAMAVLRDEADDALRQRLEATKFGMKGDGTGRRKLIESELGRALQGQPSTTAFQGNKPKERAAGEFSKVSQFAKNDDTALNRAIGSALQASGLIKSFEVEQKFGSKQIRRSDLLCQIEGGEVRLEFMWRAKITRNVLAKYVLEKLRDYGKVIDFINGG